MKTLPIYNDFRYLIWFWRSEAVKDDINLNLWSPQVSQIINLDNIYHRSKDRIDQLGEVFTPEKYVEDMLNLLAQGKKGFWSNEKIKFFEPTCGHGNIVLPIIKKRYENFLIKTGKPNKLNSKLYAYANALNSIWAVDIDLENVENCRERVFSFLILAILENEKKSLQELIDLNFDYFAQVLCAINWHIYQNDALSGLADKDSAEAEGKQTKVGELWVKNYGVKKIEFENTWVQHFYTCEENKTTPIEYERAQQFLVNLSEGYTRGLTHFKFTENVLVSKKLFKGVA